MGSGERQDVDAVLAQFAAAAEAARDADAPEQVRLQIALARGAVELAAMLELLPADEIQRWRNRLDSSLPRGTVGTPRRVVPGAGRSSIITSGGAYRRTNLVRAAPELPDVNLAAVHEFERALVIDWFQRADAPDTASHDLVRDCRATDSRGGGFSLSGGQWSRPNCLPPFGTTILLGEQHPAWPVRLELGARRAHVSLHLEDGP